MQGSGKEGHSRTQIGSAVFRGIYTEGTEFELSLCGKVAQKGERDGALWAGKAPCVKDE